MAEIRSQDLLPKKRGGRIQDNPVVAEQNEQKSIKVITLKTKNNTRNVDSFIPKSIQQKISEIHGGNRSDIMYYFE